MASIARKYRNQIHDALAGIATWLPSDKVAVGDIGPFVGNRFVKDTTIWDLGIDAELGEPESPKDFQYTSTKGIDTSFSVAAPDVNLGPTMQASGKFEITFNEDAAYLFHAYQASKVSFKVPLEVRNQVMQAYLEGRWEDNWYLIDSVYQVGRATIFVALGSNASLELSLNGEIGAGVPLSLANPNLQLSVNRSSGELFQILSGIEVTPVFTCRKMKRKFFGPKKFEPVRDAKALQWENTQPEDIPDG